jgi:hypothetical protein
MGDEEYEDQPLELEHGKPERRRSASALSSRRSPPRPCADDCASTSERAASEAPAARPPSRRASPTDGLRAVAAIGYTGKYRQTLLLHPTEPDTTVFAFAQVCPDLASVVCSAFDGRAAKDSSRLECSSSDSLPLATVNVAHSRRRSPP